MARRWWEEQESDRECGGKSKSVVRKWWAEHESGKKVVGGAREWRESGA